MIASKPEPNWLDTLPSDRLLAEFSLWSADLTQLADEIARVEPFVDLFHIDVADGHFSPVLLFFPDLVAAIRRRTAKPLHIHLMTAEAILESQLDQFAEAGADLISFHVEAGDTDRALSLIELLDIPAGLVLQLETPVSTAKPYLDRIRFLTLLGTSIGVKGKGLDPSAEPRLREARAMIDALSRRIILAGDGAIREQTVPRLRRAGADSIVMGSLAFGADDLAARIAWVHAQPTDS